jgi:PDZ domain-containing protein
MFRRAITLLVAAVLLVGFAIGGLYLPVPYLVASPGLALNTLGEVDGEQVIQVEGAETHTHDGGLSMVTVQYTGGPGVRMDLFTVLSAWLSPSQAVLPQEALFPPDRSVEEISESQTLEMDDSQTNATAAALTELGIDFSTEPYVADVADGMPAEGRLESGDVITAVDGEPVERAGEAVDIVSERDPGATVEISVERDGEPVDTEIATTEGDDGTPLVGIMIAEDMEFPVDVEISVGDVGGPSAGLMFALGIMDRLSEEGITGGHHIAGTGTITADGTVGGVSGIAQKMVSADRLGAEYFFVAGESCAQTFESAAAGDIEVVRVDDLGDAVAALENIREGGDPADLPRCEPG